MTTQAQIIEALNIGKAACLVACALEPIRANWKKWENAADMIDKQIATITAAAEVGWEPEITLEQIENIWSKKFKAATNNIRRKERERCAQWLKERDRSPHVHFLADKMCSALKEES